MARIGMLGCIACGLQELYMDLQRRIGQLAQQLRLGYDLRGHQIQDQNIQRTNILMHRAMLCHYENIF